MFKARNLFAVGFLGVLCAVGSSACMVEADEAVGDETFTRTIVHLNEDGTEYVTVETVTLQEQLAELEEEELRRQGEYEGLGTARQAIAMDSSCASSSMRMWDGTGYIGHQICFTGTGVANLTSYCRIWVGLYPGGPLVCTHRWSASVKSYKSGSTAGVFWKSHDPMRWCSDMCPMFYSNTSASPVSTCEQSGVELQLGPVTCRVMDPLSMTTKMVDVQ